MQLPKIIKRKEKEEGIQIGIQIGVQQGVQQGSKKTHDAWAEWNRRRIAAGENFDEPPPKPEYD